MDEYGLTEAQREMLDEPVQVLGLDVRTTNALEHPGYPPVVLTIRDLLACRPEELLGIPNVGVKTLDKIYRALERVGFYRLNREHVRKVRDRLEHSRLQQRRFTVGF